MFKVNSLFSMYKWLVNRTFERMRGYCILLLTRKSCEYFQGGLGLLGLVEQLSMVSISQTSGVKCGVEEFDEEGELECVSTGWCKWDGGSTSIFTWKHVLARSMRGWRGSTNYVKGGIWVEGRDIIDIGFSKYGTSINGIYFEGHVWILNNVKSKRSS